MPRLTLQFAVSLVLAASPALAASEGARIEGTWMAIGDMLGVLPAHIEVLTVTGARATSVTWRAPVADCGAEPQAPGCVLPIPTASGAFTANSFELGVAPDAAHASPFAGEPVDALWPLLALDGAPWSMFRQPGRLMTTREATLGGTTVPMLRLWLQVEPGTPEHLFDYLMAFDLDIARALCPVTTLHEDAEAWAAFTGTLAEAAPALHAHRMARMGLGDVAEDDPAYQLLDRLAVPTGDLPEGMVLLPGLPWPASPEMAEAAQDCLTRVFGD